MTEGIEIWEASSVSQTDNEDPRSDLVDVRLGLSSVTGVATVDVCVATVVVCVATVGVYVATEFAACFVESDEDSK